MASQVDGNVATYKANTALEPYRAITINSSKKAAYCGDGNGSIFHGVTQDRAVTANDGVPVKLKKASGTSRISMSVTCSIGDALYCAASGQGKTVATGTSIGMALEACSGANGVIEFLPA